MRAAASRPGFVPPPVLVRAAMYVHTQLSRLCDRMLPAPVVMMHRSSGIMVTQLLAAMAERDIASRLEAGPRSAADLGREADIDADALHRALRALASVGIFALMPDGRFGNNRLSRVLRRNQPDSLNHFCQYIGSPSSLAAWGGFPTTLQTGKSSFESVHGQTVWDYFHDHPDEEVLFAGTMTDLTEMVAPAIAMGYPFREVDRVCDVAGGRGTLLAELLSRHAHLSGVLFDSPAVVGRAEVFLRERGVASRVERVGGSMFESVPSGCDAYVLKDILHDWDDARAVRILGAIRRAMQPRHRLLVAEMLVERHSAEPPGAIVDLQMLVTTSGGRQRSATEIRALLERAEFRVTRTIDLAAPMSIVEAVPA